METTFIYALKDPNTSEIRYIGKADDPVKRLKEHYRNAAKKIQWPIYQWFNSLAGVPILEILAEVPKRCWQWFERTAIFEARELGARLLNLTKGGDGVAVPYTPERRAKISASLRGNQFNKGKGKSCSPERREKTKIALAGKPKSVEHRLAMVAAKARTRLARKFLRLVVARSRYIKTEAHRKKLSLANLGKKHSEETRAKLRKVQASRAPISEGTRLLMSYARRRFWERKTRAL